MIRSTRAATSSSAGIEVERLADVADDRLTDATEVGDERMR
jgi:hypothetical protein